MEISTRCGNGHTKSSTYGCEMTPMVAVTCNGSSFVWEIRRTWLIRLEWILSISRKETLYFTMEWNPVFGAWMRTKRTKLAGSKVAKTWTTTFRHITKRSTRWIHISLNLIIVWVSITNLKLETMMYTFPILFHIHTLSYSLTCDRSRNLQNRKIRSWLHFQVLEKVMEVLIFH